MFLARKPHKRRCCLLLYYIREYMMSYCFIAVDLTFGHIRWSGFSTASVLFFQLELITTMGGDTLRLCKYPVSYTFGLLILYSIDNFYLQQLLLGVCEMMIYFVSTIPTAPINQNSTVRKSFSFFLIYSVILSM